MNARLGGEFEGVTENGRFQGKGTYTFEGHVYEGNFDNGEFSGEGRLTLKNGCYYEGEWKNGKLVEGGFYFEDGLPYLKIGYKLWEYCSKYDPRFYEEIKQGVQNGDPLLMKTAHQYGDNLPKGAYDTIDGYYDQKSKCIYSYETKELLREPTTEEINWIKANCRVGT